MPETPEQKDSQLEGQRTDPDRSVQRASFTGYVILGLAVVGVFLLIYVLAPRG
ncbi:MULTISPECIES: hypothetical protein [unclassified Meiothermus]|uniref:hypothetical protein n=1 Tax=unclassified Meiothermus TaxID=370471 RepID=UPI00131473D1|nr:MULTISPECIES: hypothetical protein [unclassified Meiothermus]